MTFDELCLKFADLQKQMRALQRSNLQTNKNQSKILNEKTDPSFNTIPQTNQNTEDIVANSNDILTTQEGLAETYEEMNNSIIEVEEALAEVYELVIGG